MAAATSRKKPAQTLLGTQMQAQAEQAAELLKALSNPQRLRVMCMLIDSEKTVGEINAEIELSQSALSQHLAVLRGDANHGFAARRSGLKTFDHGGHLDSLGAGTEDDEDFGRVSHAIVCL